MNEEEEMESSIIPALFALSTLDVGLWVAAAIILVLLIVRRRVRKSKN